MISKPILKRKNLILEEKINQFSKYFAIVSTGRIYAEMYENDPTNIVIYPSKHSKIEFVTSNDLEKLQGNFKFSGPTLVDIKLNNTSYQIWYIKPPDLPTQKIGARFTRKI